MEYINIDLAQRAAQERAYVAHLAADNSYAKIFSDAADAAAAAESALSAAASAVAAAAADNVTLLDKGVAVNTAVAASWAALTASVQRHSWAF
jgi:hypothetical protein